MTKKISGTTEWADKNYNCVDGCEHNCRYCYARFNAVVRFQRIKLEDWERPQVRKHDVDRRMGRICKHAVMFPTTHDITPQVLDACETTIQHLLDGGNPLLIVSKPHIECIMSICKRFEAYMDQILFRFTIGALDETILEYWEPGAPRFLERFQCLKLAWQMGYKTSVSVEPMLDGDNVIELFAMLEPFVNDAIWIGKMNKVKERTKTLTPTDELHVSKIIEGQTDEKIWTLYNELKDEPKVKWKESIKSVVGLDLATEAGVDE